ncbi:MAG: hypothetical protein ACP5OG_04070 [Candidatus Nanoarchaeia archaeon]
MATLTHKATAFQNREVEKSIVEILTNNWVRTSVYLPKQKGMILPQLIGINSVAEGKPINLGFYKAHERGLFNPKQDDRYYLIDEPAKQIITVENKFDLFYDADKVPDNTKYLWNGSFEDILEEFKNAGYKTFNGIGGCLK